MLSPASSPQWIEQKPAENWTINWSHPLTRGLVFATILGGPGSFPAPMDFVSGTRGDTQITGGGSTHLGLPQIDPNITGVDPGGIVNPNANANILFTVPDGPFIQATGLTLYFFGRITTSASGPYYSFGSKCATNGATNSPFDFRTDNNNGLITAPNISICVVRANAGGFQQYGPSGGAAGAQISRDVFIRQFITFADNNISTAPIWYGDSGGPGFSSGSTLVSIGGTGSGAVTGSGSTLNLLLRSDSAVAFTGSYSGLYIWNRPLTGGEITAMITSPSYIGRAEHSIFQQPASPIRRFVFSGVGRVNSSNDNLNGVDTISRSAPYRIQQGITPVPTFGGSFTATLANPAIGGNTIIGFFAQAGTSVPVNFPNKWIVDSNNGNVQVVARYPASGGETTFSITTASGVTGTFYVEEWAGIAQVDTVTATTNNSSTVTSDTMTTTGPPSSSTSVTFSYITAGTNLGPVSSPSPGWNRELTIGNT